MGSSSGPNSQTGRPTRRLTAVMSLALWRWRQHWFLLMMTGVGMIAAVTLVCMLPLLTVTLQTAGLHDTLTTSPAAAELSVNAQAIGLSTQTMNIINQYASSPIQDNLGTYLQSQARLEIQAPELSIISPDEAQLRTPLRLYGNPIAQTASHLVLTRGRLPRSTGKDVEIALTPETASALHVQVGSTLIVTTGFSIVPAQGSIETVLPSYCSIIPGKSSTPGSQTTYCQQITLHVVGLFEVKTNDYFWHGENFQPVSLDTRWHYAAITSNQTMLAAFDSGAANYGAIAAYFLKGYNANLNWYFSIDPARVTLDHLDDLINQLAATQVGIGQANGQLLSSAQSIVTQFYLQGAVLSNNAIPSSLENFRNRIAIARIPAVILTLQIICLLLYFVSIMVELLIDRQASTIAMMRSRGASTAQIFGSHLAEGLLPGLLALISGPLLAYMLAVSVAGSMLPTGDQDALKVISGDPVTAILNIKWYALTTVGVIIAVLMAALYRASRIHPQARRSGAARPLWQRLNLDLVAAVIALTGYGVAAYLANIGGLLDTQTQALVSAPIALIAPVFLLLAAVLLFLRATPLLFRGISRLLARGRGAVPLLSFTQIERSPRQSMRMIILLALATAFAIFTLIFSASQAQRATDIASYQAGADFSGAVPFNAPTNPPRVETARYQQIAGVLAASAGYVAEETVGQTLFPLQVRAIDPRTFEQAAIWNSQYSSQPLDSLLAQLTTMRQASIRQGVIPALVDAYTWNTLGLHAGELFLVHQGSSLTQNTRYVAVAEVQSIPTLTNNDVAATQQLGNMIVDYQTFAAIQLSQAGFEAPANYVWLRTSDNPTSIAHIRGVLQSSNLYLNNLNDRHALVGSLQSDPLYLNIIIILASGVIAVLLLALVGDLLASWLSVRNRLSQFVVLRALGTSLRQVVGIMACEQGLVYLLALLLGAGFGILLALTVVPALVIATFSVAPGNISSTTFYIIQQIIPTQMVFPWSLGIAFAALVALCGAAVGIMAWVALRPSLSPMLRLDEEQAPLLSAREETGTALAMPVRRSSRRAGFSFMTLAFGQARRTWFLLGMTGIGVIAAIVMVCAIPLFSDVMTTAGLQTTLNATDAGSEFTLDATMLGLSTQVAQSVQHKLSPSLQAHLGSFLHQSPQFSVQQAGYTLNLPGSLHSYYPMKFFAMPMSEAAPHLTLLQGRLPVATQGVNGIVEALITAPSAQSLHIKVGSLIETQFQYATSSAQINSYHFTNGKLKVRIVGVFKPNSLNDYVWHGDTFQAVPGDSSSSTTFLIPRDTFFTTLDRVAAAAHANVVFSTSAYELLWDYRLDTSSITYSQFPDLANRLGSLQRDVENTYGNLQNSSQAAISSTYPYLIQASVYGPLYGSFTILTVLQSYLNRVDVFRVPAAILALQVIGLILLFISLTADILVEHQAAAIAVLRSRGASNSQIAACLVTQGIGISILTLIIGPPLALVTVSAIALRLLGAQAQGAINLVISHPVQAILDVGWYALATALVVMLALSLLFRRAASINILSLRRETARSSRATMWQHLRLDGGAAIIAITAFGLSLYLTRLGNQLNLSTKTLLLAPLSIVAAIFFIFAIMILFLRFFPLLLRLGAWLVMRGRGAISMMTFAQIARSPRYTARAILLPAFAIAFVIFALVFNTSQAQRITAISNYEVGTDFSGNIPAGADNLSLQDEIAVYRAIPGVTSASAGLSAQGSSAHDYPYQILAMQIMAVDADTFAHAVIWTKQNSAQSLASLMAKLVAGRAGAVKNDVIPCIVDAAAVQKLHLTPGATFLTAVRSEAFNPLNCVVVAIVQHIPTINNNANAGSGGNDSAPIGIMMDYQTYFQVYTATSANFGPAGGTPEPFNHIWLRTSDDAVAVSQVRAALQTKELRLDNLLDRRALIDEMNSDPLYRNLQAFLTLGAITTLLLALLGDLLASWLSARARLTQFAVFRALGAAPRHVVGMLTWEQGIVHVTAILLGGVFGAILAIVAIPALIFTNLPAGGAFGNLSNADFYLLQQVLPPQIVVPSSLNMILFGLLFFFVIALATMLWVALRPSSRRRLRLSED